MPPRDALPTRTPGATFDHPQQPPQTPPVDHTAAQFTAHVSAMYNTRNNTPE